jgi:DNA-directed RNA polymerase specialized sigma24 family protein
LNPAVRELASAVLTAKQLEAWELWEEGLGYGRIGLKLGISTSAARNRIHSALRNIEVELERKGTTPHPVRKSDGTELAPAA